MTSLLDFANNPEATPNPLPHLGSARRSGSWPVGLLPLRELAEDLARFGYRYKRGSGFSALGATAPYSVDPYDVASAAALILNMAADALAYTKPLGDVWAATADELETYADRLQAEAHDVLGDDYELAEAVYTPLAFMPTTLAAHYRHLLESAEGATAERHAASIGDRFNEHADKLRRTARDLKASPSAQTTFLKALRAVLPAPEEATVDESAAVDFLASLDAVTTLKRSDLPRLYAEAGRPGDLSGAELRELADARWGAARKFQGHYLYRPAKATA